MNPSMCGLAPVYESRQDDEEMIFEGEPQAEDLSFIGKVADFESEVVKRHDPNESLLDDDIASALLNGINNKSVNLSLILEPGANDSVVASDGSRSIHP